MSTITLDLDELKAKVGSHLGYSSWHTITQEQVNLFADATNDHRVDPRRPGTGQDRAVRHDGCPWVLHLSLGPSLLAEILAVDGPRFAVNYGLNRVRFPAPVPVDPSCAAAPASSLWRTSRAGAS